jgi:acetylornithine/N-succinyldiaminopimelate aminotransferase
MACPLGLSWRKRAAWPWSLGTNGSTFGGNALTTAAAYAGTKYLIDHDIPAHVKRMEPYLLTHLQALQDRFACVAAVRGKGLLAAMEFDSDIAGRVVTHANKAGVLLNAVRPNAVRFMPPLTITVEEVDEAAERLEKALQQL